MKELTPRTYSLLKRFFAGMRDQVEKDWCSACSIFDGVKGKKFEEAYQNIKSEFREIDEAEEQIRDLIHFYFKKHKNKKLSEYWCGEDK